MECESALTLIMRLSVDFKVVTEKINGRMDSSEDYILESERRIAEQVTDKMTKIFDKESV